MFPFSTPPWPLPPTHPTPAHSTHTRTRTSPTRCDTAPLDKGWKEIVPSHRRVQGEESEIIIDTGRHYPVRFYLALLPTTQLVRDLVGIHVGPLLPVDLGRGKRQGVLVRNRIERADMDTDTASARTCATRSPKTGGARCRAAALAPGPAAQNLRRTPNSHALYSLGPRRVVRR